MIPNCISVARHHKAPSTVSCQQPTMTTNPLKLSRKTAHDCGSQGAASEGWGFCLPYGWLLHLPVHWSLQPRCHPGLYPLLRVSYQICHQICVRYLKNLSRHTSPWPCLELSPYADWLRSDSYKSTLKRHWCTQAFAANLFVLYLFVFLYSALAYLEIWYIKKMTYV